MTNVFYLNIVTLELKKSTLLEHFCNNELICIFSILKGNNLNSLCITLSSIILLNPLTPLLKN